MRVGKALKKPFGAGLLEQTVKAAIENYSRFFKQHAIRCMIFLYQYLAEYSYEEWIKILFPS